MHVKAAVRGVAGVEGKAGKAEEERADSFHRVSFQCLVSAQRYPWAIP
jgi:hypothetical protein